VKFVHKKGKLLTKLNPREEMFDYAFSSII